MLLSVGWRGDFEVGARPLGQKFQDRGLAPISKFIVEMAWGQGNAVVMM
jgi:hypothetical protein